MTLNPYEFPMTTATPEIKNRRRRSTLLELLVVIAIASILAALILPATRSARPNSYRTQCQNNLQNVTLALIAYASAHKAFPPAYTIDSNGNRLHSWRTLILPHLDQQELYDSIDFSKPWNHPANAKAFSTTLGVFSCPSAKLPPGFTVYLGNAAIEGCFDGSQPRPLTDITDPPGQTLLVVEVSSSHAVHWMAPEDADGDTIINAAQGSGTAHMGLSMAGFVDGRVRTLSDNLDVSVRRALISIAGDDAVDASTL